MGKHTVLLPASTQNMDVVLIRLPQHKVLKDWVVQRTVMIKMIRNCVDSSQEPDIVNGTRIPYWKDVPEVVASADQKRRQNVQTNGLIKDVSSSHITACVKVPINLFEKE